jgi:hypothetical protein
LKKMRVEILSFSVLKDVAKMMFGMDVAERAL